MKPSLSLKQIGIWTGTFEQQPARKIQETVAELEELGYGAVWFSEATGRETSRSRPCCWPEVPASWWPMESLTSMDAILLLWFPDKRH
jgi:alkanesulfonate monooxygenase SsuD/methylene tetrahydromethanopterin reductase-like flavin-dependent oxidoreductase (luciferase family)